MHECVRKEFAGAVLMAYILKIYIVMVVRKGFTGTIRMACTVYGLYSYGLNGYGREERVRRDRTCNLPCSIPFSGRMQRTMHQPYSTTCSMRATHHASSMRHGMHPQRTTHSAPYHVAQMQHGDYSVLDSSRSDTGSSGTCIVMAYTIMAYVAMTNVVMAYIVMAYGLCSYGLHSHGLHSYGASST